MRFAAFFSLLGLYLGDVAVSESDPLTACLFYWLTGNAAFMAAAYWLNNPFLVLGKQIDGAVNPLLTGINLPWLLLTWLTFWAQAMLTREDFCNRIQGTRIWVSSRPGKQTDLGRFDLVIDLTCEFPADVCDGRYLCFPNLDGHGLAQLPHTGEIPAGGDILIHCANGHGRSALFASFLLREMKIAGDMEAALNMIQLSRPLAKPNSAQRKWLLNR